jgi:hypothetical protein
MPPTSPLKQTFSQGYFPIPTYIIVIDGSGMMAHRNINEFREQL